MTRSNILSIAAGGTCFWAVAAGLYVIGALAWTVTILLAVLLFVLLMRIMDAPGPDHQMAHDMRSATGVCVALIVMVGWVL